jgi:hypothetical protein
VCCERVCVCVLRGVERLSVAEGDKQQTSPLGVCPMVVRYRQTGRAKAQNEDLGSHSIRSLFGTSRATEFQMDSCGVLEHSLYSNL